MKIRISGTKKFYNIGPWWSQFYLYLNTVDIFKAALKLTPVAA
jgi:hypothetical protein